MYINHSGNLPEEIESGFKASLNIRPCTYKPSLEIVPGYYENTVRGILSLEKKNTWYHTFCKENNKAPCIDTSQYEIREMGTDENGQKIFYVIVTAKVYIDGVLLSAEPAGQSGSYRELDSMLQFASGIAKSRALTSAGFGTISGSDFDATGAMQNNQSQQLAGNGAAGNQTNNAGNNPASNRVGNPLPSSAVSGQQNQVPPSNPPQSQSANPSAQMMIPGTESASSEDPTAAAKAVICSLNGPTVSGKTMGHILATDPNTIIWIATKAKISGPTKEAAEALLPLALKATGRKA